MKKVILLAAIAVLGVYSANAQSVEFGAKGGLNLSSFSGDGFDAFEDPQTRTSFNLGLVAEVPLTDKFSIQPEVYYSGQGFDIRQRDNGNDTEYQLDYINVPVLAKYYLIEGLSIQAGPQIGFNINSEIDSNPSGDSGDVDLDDNAFNDVDFAIATGAEYKFSNGIFLFARYNIGISDVFNNEELAGPDIDAKNAVFSTGLGFFF